LGLIRSTSVAQHVYLDPRLARGLSYYTGAIMEIAVEGIGSLGGGGRYDNLIGMFLGRDVPACGFSLGLERIIVVMTEREMFPPSVDQSVVDVVVTFMDDNSSSEALKLASELRAAGCRVDVYPEASRKFEKALKYAAGRGARVMAIFGENERGRRKQHPKLMLNDLEACLVDKYGRDQVERDRRCITVWFEKRNQTQDEEGKVLSLDVVPAFERGDDYEIPDETLGTWIATNPATHAAEATAKNKALSGNWVPLVKMLKSWNRHAGRPITPSYLVEVMALELVDGPFNSFPDEARRFFAAAASTVADDWPDPAGLGPPISDEMTASRCSTAREALSAAEVLASRAYRAEQQGRQGEALALWKQVFGRFFPSS